MAGLTAMWVWSVADAAASRSVVRTALALGLDEMYVSVPWGGADPVVVDCVDRLRAAGVRVAALGSEPGWALRPAAAATWVRRALSGAAFDGIHLDVEPWTLPEWRTDRPRVIVGYLAMLDAVRVAIGGGRLAVDVAPVLAEQRHSGRSALAAALDRVDSVTIMAYRDRARGGDGILAFSAACRAACAAAAIPYRLGIETQPAAVVGDGKLTFHEEGRSAVHRETAVLARDLAGDPLYRGVAVHDWKHWLALRL